MVKYFGRKDELKSFHGRLTNEINMAIHKPNLIGLPCGISLSYQLSMFNYLLVFHVSLLMLTRD